MDGAQCFKNTSSLALFAAAPRATVFEIVIVPITSIYASI